MESISLYDLNEYIRRVIALNLPEAMWVRCEIAQLKPSRGHFYLELVEKQDENNLSGSLKAQAQAVIWNRTHQRLLRKNGAELNYLLQDGMEVLLKVEVDFHEQYGLKLVIQDIDPTYTLGKLELKRRAILKTLKEQNLMAKNGEISLPLVLQKIAIISSERAAGYQDYLQHLSQNDYQYAYKNELFPAAMQGLNTEKEILKQLKKIERQSADFDCIIIIRGGGAKLDLAAFDNLELAKAVANSSLPVFTGIGHDIDETVLDKVAHLSLKTPTAVADFFIHRMLQFESHLLNIGLGLKEAVNQLLQTQDTQLKQLTQTIDFQSNKTISQAQQMLDFIEIELPRTVKYRFEKEESKLENLKKLVSFLSPEATLKRGFSLTTKDGEIVKNKAKLKQGDVIETHFVDGKVKSEVLKK
ncbi:MAG: exodeoxyribonuclease VII large subunit [Saprospiraceae bacterium]